MKKKMKNKNIDNIKTLDANAKWLEKTPRVRQYLTPRSLPLLDANTAGDYLASCIIIDSQDNHHRIPLYIGESSCIGKRLRSHLKRWFGNGYAEYWIGISEKAFEEGKVKLDFEVLAAESDLLKRLEIEQRLIQLHRPVLQDPVGSLYPKYNNSTKADMCIIPFNGTRKKAWMHRMEELGIEAVDFAQEA